MRLYVSLQKQFEGFGFQSEFSVEGERIGIFGRSGSGKSTLVNMLAGLITPDAGEIRMDERILYNSAERINVSPERRRIAVVFQHAHLFPHMSVRRNLLYGYNRIAKAERKFDPETLYRVLDLERLLSRSVNALSGGERQRVALGRAVLACPKLILMDEPLTGLDEGLKHQIIPFLRSAFAEFAIPLLFISHSLNEMRLMTDQVLEFESGRLVGQTSAEELARCRMGKSQVGYINLLHLERSGERDGMCVFRWGGRELYLSHGACNGGGEVFELSSKDIMLFKRHPEAISARNLIVCRVAAIFEMDGRVGVELDCGGGRLISQIVPSAAEELGIRPGTEIFAAFKASAFRVLY
jgi:molybdate transport system ATP-binding protein